MIIKEGASRMKSKEGQKFETYVLVVHSLDVGHFPQNYPKMPFLKLIAKHKV